VTLREHGAQPRREAAPAVILAQQRCAASFGNACAVEVGVDRVRQFPRAARSVERVGRPIQHGTEFLDEYVPRLFVAIRAPEREREIVEVKSRQELLDLARGRLPPLEGASGGGGERRAEVRLRHSPAFRVAAAMERGDKGIRDRAHGV
jgi:hypothetical protein